MTKCNRRTRTKMSTRIKMSGGGCRLSQVDGKEHNCCNWRGSGRTPVPKARHSGRRLVPHTDYSSGDGLCHCDRHL